jgi:hypothetical protein
MEEECCHNYGVNQFRNGKSSQMLGGDKSLNNFLNTINERREQQTIKVYNFQENKSKSESFYKTNIQTMMENNNKLKEAKEKYKLKRLEYLSKKELCFEMDPFTWELIRCRDGTTTIKIIEEADEHKNWGKEEVIEEES